MTIGELLAKIAGTDRLPRQWQVERGKTWLLHGATEPEVQERAEIEFWDDGMYRRFGELVFSARSYERDHIEAIIVDPGVPAAVLLPFVELADQHYIKLQTRATEIPF